MRHEPTLRASCRSGAILSPRSRRSTRSTRVLCLLLIHPRAPNLISLQSAGHHACMISSFVRALISAFKARPELALESVALRASGDSGFSPASAGSRSGSIRFFRHDGLWNDPV